MFLCSWPHALYTQCVCMFDLSNLLYEFVPQLPTLMFWVVDNRRRGGWRQAIFLFVPLLSCQHALQPPTHTGCLCPEESTCGDGPSLCCLRLNPNYYSNLERGRMGSRRHEIKNEKRERRDCRDIKNKDNKFKTAMKFHWVNHIGEISGQKTKGYIHIHAHLKGCLTWLNWSTPPFFSAQWPDLHVLFVILMFSLRAATLYHTDKSHLSCLLWMYKSVRH